VSDLATPDGEAGTLSDHDVVVASHLAKVCAAVQARLVAPSTCSSVVERLLGKKEADGSIPSWCSILRWCNW
jgi:hypothetical protein